MAHLSNAVFTGVNTAYSADTGSGGLAETGNGAARLHHLVEEDGPQPGVPSQPWARLVVRDIEQDRIGQGAAEAIVEFVVYTESGYVTTKRRAVTDRIRELFHDNSSISLSGWTFDGMHHLGGGPLGSQGQWRRWSERFIVYATES